MEIVWHEFAKPQWRHLPQGTVRTVHVVMVDVLGQHRLQLLASEDEHPVQHLASLLASEDEHPVQHLASNGAHPPLRVGVRPRRPHRRDEHLHRLGGKDRIERGGELGIPVAEHQPEPTDALLEVHH